MKSHLFILFIFFILKHSLLAQPFTLVSPPPFEGTTASSAAFADVDGDDDLDLLISGITNSSDYISKLYSNDGLGNFTEVTETQFEGLAAGTIHLEDVDGDNDIDVFITGQNDAEVPVSKLYLNDGTGNFTELMNAPFEGAEFSSVAFADIDGDDDLDLLIAGDYRPIIRESKLYTNDGQGNFIEVENVPFLQVEHCSVAFADIDGDKDVDVLITGLNINTFTAKLYTNDGTGTFTEEAGTPFEALGFSAIAFSDVDGDDDPDLLITGESQLGRIAKLYMNDGQGNFTENTDTPFEGVGAASVAFGDYDGDNDPDLLISGFASSSPSAKLYKNEGMGNFSEVLDVPFEGTEFGSVNFADIDGDNDLDVFISGLNKSSDRTAELYINDRIIASSRGVRNRPRFDFLMYPNPTNLNRLEISYDSQVNGWIKACIFDLQGRLLSKQEKPALIGALTFSVDVSFLSAGAYILQLDDGTRMGSGKILVK